MAYKTIEEERAYGARPYRRAAMLVKQREYDASRRGKATRKRYQHKKRLSKEGRAYILMSAARIRAARDGWAFDLDLDWVKRKIYAGTCEVSGLPFDLRTQQPTFRCNHWPLATSNMLGRRTTCEHGCHTVPLERWHNGTHQAPGLTNNQNYPRG